MNFRRSSGIILHPSSFPGEYGIGDLGKQAYKWIDFLNRSGTGLWQILPLGPTGYGDSPYQCFSAFAGNHYLISPDLLYQEGLLYKDDLKELPPFPTNKVDYGQVIPWKITLLDRAFNNFERNAPQKLYIGLEEFRAKNSIWIEDFALFMTLKESHNWAPWTSWKEGLRDRTPGLLEKTIRDNKRSIDRQVFYQYLFYWQWHSLRSYAHAHGIKIIGDTPIFVAHDSSDVWAHPDLFYLDGRGNPTVVAGVPPDYFSRTGQLWGNPLYRWPLHKKDGYSWWLARLKAVLESVDFIRLDHFRGFAGYWEVPAGLPTAEKGRWVTGPGADFFNKIQEALGDLPIIAEDLGEITPDVVQLRDQFNLPGMKILQFAFASDADDKFLPHNYTQNFVGYTGTHDNDTTTGWFHNVPKNEVDSALKYLGLTRRSTVEKFTSGMIRSLWGSVSIFALAPLQDFLGLGTEARMNYPGNPSGNWNWRMPESSLTPALVNRIKILNQTYGRTAIP